MTASFARKLVYTILAVLSAHSLVAQEAALAWKFTEGKTLKFKVTSNSMHEGGLFTGGRLEERTQLYYSLAVGEVDREGTATVTYRQDSIAYWTSEQMAPPSYLDELTGVPVTMWFSNRGILLDAKFPADLSKEAANYLDGIVKDFGTEPPIPGVVSEVGAAWQSSLPVYFVYPFGTVQADNTVKVIYARNESYRGTNCARVEYSGNLVSLGQKVGSVKGTMHHALREGKKLLNSSETEALIYMEARGGRSQIRFRNTQTREALN